MTWGRAYAEVVTAVLRDAARDVFCEVLRSVEPTAPTLCDGWTAHRLAAHVSALSDDPWVWVLKVTSPVKVDQRLAAIEERSSYEELIGRISRMRGFRCMPFDALEGNRHALGEFVIHTEDVRRANGLVAAAPVGELADALWQRTQVAARQLHRRGPGLRLVRTDAAGAEFEVVEGEGSGVSGPVLEVLLWVYGRRTAEVQVRPRSRLLEPDGQLDGDHVAE